MWVARGKGRKRRKKLAVEVIYAKKRKHDKEITWLTITKKKRFFSYKSERYRLRKLETNIQSLFQTKRKMIYNSYGIIIIEVLYVCCFLYLNHIYF